MLHRVVVKTTKVNYFNEFLSNIMEFCYLGEVYQRANKKTTSDFDPDFR